MPAAWETYKIHYRYRQTIYHITISRLPGDSPDPASLSLDGVPGVDNRFPLHDDRLEHEVEMKVR
jgi:cellobiose phosphorylase